MRGLIALALFVSAAAQASDLEPKQLLGRWTGEMSFKVGGETNKAPVTMTFSEGGKLVTQSGKSKEETSTWRIDGDTVLLVDPNNRGNDIRLTELRFNGARLEAQMHPAKTDTDTPEVTMKLTLKRAQ